MSKLLEDGDSERFGPYRAQCEVYTAGEGWVELAFTQSLVLDREGLRDLADWLTRVVAPSIGSIHESAVARGDWAEEDE